MKSILNAQRLLQLSHFSPKLKGIWYLAAASVFSVANQPQEIPKLYHYALALGGEDAHKFKVTLAHNTTELLNNPDRQRIINEMYDNPTSRQLRISEKFRETLLKTAPLAGLPKAINGLQALKEVTPGTLLPHSKEIDPWNIAMGLERPCPMILRDEINSMEDQNKMTRRGVRHWNLIYNKVSGRVVNNLNSSYPDLWYFTMKHVYGPLLSFDKILNAQETSLIIIASLIPQDVNPQLRGHMKGALNIGCELETVEILRRFSILISEWCGIEWKEDVVKLLPKTRKLSK
ncbi:hypothetical protein KAFR_0G00800 [Kazachstania africana CBS 2517]|uniref:Carboxymuconolactone decarboxylase-like domain-containing protein n=1 Tax=Kazachstania africana (strain ATCC 22294 / BCRC 22015 / CBS 2517 / CECT 1963 / NBRC 1671 / NRRL Y-8276) TaxID=1071382 RepID=H2AXL3_KAZAF|nr:hypothetical protein KAFR_0G00800 [Kazachstania africana CBS 2517]CCF59113.1 hypothetical protein KAFR_0G00800 [Kazachstania africana CBS 2517]